jgi:hypothetical protein
MLAVVASLAGHRAEGKRVESRSRGKQRWQD